MICLRTFQVKDLLPREKTAFFFFDSMLQQIKKNETGSKFLFNAKKFSALLAQINALFDRPVLWLKKGPNFPLTLCLSLYMALLGIFVCFSDYWEFTRHATFLVVSGFTFSAS